MVNKIIKFSTILLITIICFTGCDAPRFEDASTIVDSVNFKTEYEGFNLDNYELNIDKENPFKYLTNGNLFNVIKSNAIIYFGYPEDRMSREVVNILLDLSNEKDLDNIYYMNVLVNRSNYELVNDELKMVEEGSSLYLEMIKLLDSNLKSLEIRKDDVIYKIDDKIIDAPSILFIKDGKVLKYYNDFSLYTNKEFIGFSEKDIVSIKNELSILIDKVKN